MCSTAERKLWVGLVGISLSSEECDLESYRVYNKRLRDAAAALLSKSFSLCSFLSKRLCLNILDRGEETPNGWPDVSSHFGSIDLGGFEKDRYYYCESKAWAVV